MCGVCGCDHAHHDHADSGNALDQAEVVKIEQSLFSHNQSHADQLRIRLSEAGIFAVNIVSSPGSGKTALLVKTLEAVQAELPCAVIEGDQQTALDADRIAATGVAVKQINTGHACHLDAHRVDHAVDDLALQPNSLLFIENVGNLVCPANFDLGEAKRIVLLSVTEGDDKPLKYPDIFVGADLLLVTKTDLLPYVDFDVSRCIANARKISGNIEAITLSSKSGAGMADWVKWLQQNAALLRSESSLAAS